MKLTESQLRKIVREELVRELYDPERHKEDVYRSMSPSSPEEAIEAAAEYEFSMQVDNTPSDRFVFPEDAKDVPEEAVETLDEYMQRTVGRDANRREKQTFKKKIAQKVRDENADRHMRVT